uniref:Uncharacterized protein n=1 Tax=Solanum tuberosum TaxID=4113 RepID=M1DJN2_SOLTU
MADDLHLRLVSPTTDRTGRPLVGSETIKIWALITEPHLRRHEVQLDKVNPSPSPTHSARESEWAKAEIVLHAESGHPRGTHLIRVREVSEIVYGGKKYVQLVDRRQDRQTRLFPPSNSRHCQLGSCKNRQPMENYWRIANHVGDLNVDLRLESSHELQILSQLAKKLDTWRFAE